MKIIGEVDKDFSTKAMVKLLEKNNVSIDGVLVHIETGSWFGSFNIVPEDEIELYNKLIEKDKDVDDMYTRIDVRMEDMTEYLQDNFDEITYNAKINKTLEDLTISYIAKSKCVQKENMVYRIENIM